MLINHQAKKHGRTSAIAGFTMIELLTVILFLGILSAIAAPGWLAFINNYRLSRSSERVYWAIRTAQSNAKHHKTDWQATFREKNGVVQLAVHPATLPPGKTLNDLPESKSGSLTESTWHNLEEKVAIDRTKSTLTQVTTDNIKQRQAGIYRALFNYTGCPLMDRGQECGPGGLGKLTLQHQDLGNNKKRCTIISTLLGAMRTAEDARCNPRP